MEGVEFPQSAAHTLVCFHLGYGACTSFDGTVKSSEFVILDNESSWSSADYLIRACGSCLPTTLHLSTLF